MRPARFTPLTILSLLALLLVGASDAFAGECPFSGTSYMAPYTSPIGLPRCGGTIGRWAVCEVCQLSNATFTEQQAYTQSYPAAGTGLQPVATFTQGATSLTVNGFFDGITVDNHAIFRIRFAPTPGWPSRRGPSRRARRPRRASCGATPTTLKSSSTTTAPPGS
jgi:hypothetical protein